MLRFIIKDRYQCKFGRSFWTSEEAAMDRLIEACKAVVPQQTDIPKDDCPGFAIARLHPRFDTPHPPVNKLAFMETSMLVLDIDDVPSSVSNIGLWLPIVLPPKVKALWYTTPRYRESAKRIRVVIPMTRFITMEEKYDLQFRLKIEGVDKASFEAAKFSLLPCWCKDTVEFTWGTVGTRYLDPDKDLPSYQRPRLAPQPPRSSDRQRLVHELEKLVEVINDAPDHHSQEVTKPGLSKIFRQFDSPLSACEDVAQDIVRSDRRNDFIGIATWLSRQG